MSLPEAREWLADIVWDVWWEIDQKFKVPTRKY
jgi:hypothetical protein